MVKEKYETGAILFYIRHMKISAVVAAAENNAIGLKGNLLWRLPDDMEFFKRITMGHYILMGRKTWDSLPKRYRPLDGRVNMVVTRQVDYNPDGGIRIGSVEEGIEYAKGHGEKELMIIGGGEIYKQAFPLLDTIHLTRVHQIFSEADAFFPDIVPEEWNITSREEHQADGKHAYPFDFITLERKV